MLKKIFTSLLLSVAIFCTAVPCTLGADNTAEDTYSMREMYYKRLQVLGVPVDEDYDGYVTRGQFAEIAVAMSSFDVAGSAETVFSDVPAGSEYFESVNAAYAKGYMSGYGDGTFRPDDYITTEQMLKVFLCMAGYGVYAEQYGGYPSGYWRLAGSNNLIASGAESGYVEMDELVYTAYKALELPIVYVSSYIGTLAQYASDDDGTLLNNLLIEKELNFANGICTFDGYTYTYKTGTPEPLYAEIDGVRYNNPNTDLSGYIGRHVEYWYNDDNEIVAIYMYRSKNSSVTYSADDIEEASLSRYTVTDNKSSKTLKLDSGAVIIYNKSFLDGVSEEDLIPENGSVQFVDNDEDGTYEIVFINEKNYYVVDSISTSGLSIRYKQYGTQTETGYSIDETDLNDTIFYNVCTDEGASVSYDGVSVGSVISVAKNADGNIINVIVTKKQVDGTVNSLKAGDNASVTIDGTEYKIAKAKDGEPFELGVTAGNHAEFYLNEESEIVYCSETRSSSTRYAYVTNAWSEGDGATMGVKLVLAGTMGSITNTQYSWVQDKLAQNDSVAKYILKENIKYNGTLIKSSNIAMLKGNVVEVTIEDEVVTKIAPLEAAFEMTEAKYNHNTKGLVQPGLTVDGYDNPALLLNGNIQTLVIPNNTGETYTDDAYLAKYRIENSSSDHDVVAYELTSGSQTPKLLVLKESLTESGTAQGDSDKGIVTVGVGRAMQDGESYYEITMISNEGSTESVLISEDVEFTDSSIKRNIADIAVGDIIEVGRNSKDVAVEIRVIESSASPVDAKKFGTVSRLESNAIWTDSDGDTFYNIFVYETLKGKTVVDGVEADNPIFKYTSGRTGTVTQIDIADIIAGGDDASTVLLAGGIAVVLD